MPAGPSPGLLTLARYGPHTGESILVSGWDRVEISGTGVERRVQAQAMYPTAQVEPLPGLVEGQYTLPYTPASHQVFTTAASVSRRRLLGHTCTNASTTPLNLLTPMHRRASEALHL